MHEVWFPKRDLLVEVPEYYDELCGKKDAIKIGEVLFLVFTQQVDPVCGKKLAVDYFLNRKNDTKKPVAGKDAWDYWANEARLTEVVDWLFEAKEVKLDKSATGLKTGEDTVAKYEINPTLTRQHISRMRFGSRVYYGPGDLFSGLSFLEFKEASACVEQFVETADIAWLDRLCTVLYSRKIRYWRIRRLFGMDKDNLRRRFSEYRSSRAMSDICTAPVGFKFWCFLFFVGCLNYIRKEPVIIDGKEYSLHRMFGGDGGGKDDTGLSGVLFTMAESGVFGSLEETGHASYYDVILRLYQIHMQSVEIKSRMPKK